MIRSYHCSVVIPTKNAMPRFKGVLDAVLAQDTPWPFETVVIDSGSVDDTAAYAERQQNVRVIQIAPETFRHGRTRNQAIATCNSPYVALLTHDAQPADKNWLVNLVRAVEQDDHIAGAFGRHIAWPTADPFTKTPMQIGMQTIQPGANSCIFFRTTTHVCGALSGSAFPTPMSTLPRISFGRDRQSRWDMRRP